PANPVPPIVSRLYQTGTVRALRHELARQEKTAARLSEELAKARYDAEFSAKRQALREADLQELQARYDALSSAHAADRERLAQVAGKLRAAAARFREAAGQPGTPAPAKRPGED